MRRALPALLLTVALAVLLGGCGATDTVGAQDVSAAAVKTTDAGSSRVAVIAEDDQSRTTMTGVIDYESRLARFSFLERPKQSEKVDRTAFEMRFVGTTAFIESKLLGLYAGGVPGTEPKPWLSLDWSEVDVTLDSLVFPFPFVDPARLLAALDEVSGETEELGELDIRGVATNGYRLSIDLVRLIEEAPPKVRAALRQELESTKEKTLPIEVWLDDEGLARRVRIQRDEDVTMDFFDFGVEVDVQAPPDDQVESFDDLFSAVEGEGSFESSDEELDSYEEGE